MSVAYSTAVSDAVLCAVALFGAVTLATQDARPSRRLAALGFCVLALSAALGVLRFGFCPQLEVVHRLSASAAAMVGMPLIAWSLWVEARGARTRILLWAGALTLVALWAALHAVPAWRLAMGLGTQLLWLALAWRWWALEWSLSAWIVLAVMLTLAAGLVVGNQGEWRGMPRLDLLHYLLAAAQLALIAAIRIERQLHQPEAGSGQPARQGHG